MNRFRALYFIFACLFAVVIFVGISTLSNRLYDTTPTSIQPSNKVTKNNALKEKPQTLDVSLSLNERLQQGDFEHGRKIFHQCALCHTSGRNESGRVGPALWEIVNRSLASTQGFAYSRALRAHSDQKWDFTTLDRYLHSPQKTFPGTIMSFRGIKNDQDRADLLLYLRSLSDHPVPLPTDDNKETKPNN